MSLTLRANFHVELRPICAARPLFISNAVNDPAQSSCLHRASLIIKHFIIQLMHNI